MKRTKTNPFDWALIQWARLCEESKIVDPTKVEPTLDPEKDDMGRLSDPLAWLASRAKKTLASLGLDGARWLDRSVSVWFASALFVVALGALVFPIARADRILDSVYFGSMGVSPKIDLSATYPEVVGIVGSYVRDSVIYQLLPICYNNFIPHTGFGRFEEIEDDTEVFMEYDATVIAQAGRYLYAFDDTG
ncbi:MAG: hypothetical protein II150_06815, partial [Thermoguttaceae bacterium]|nr:hypothetical protein [Thermoguttaceae bacterium]